MCAHFETRTHTNPIDWWPLIGTLSTERHVFNDVLTTLMKRYTRHLPFTTRSQFQVKMEWAKYPLACNACCYVDVCVCVGLAKDGHFSARFTHYNLRSVYDKMTVFRYVCKPLEQITFHFQFILFNRFTRLIWFEHGYELWHNFAFAFLPSKFICICFFLCRMCTPYAEYASHTCGKDPARASQ